MYQKNMIKIKKFIAQITVKRNLKWVLIFLVLWWLFVGKTYAAGDGDMSLSDTVAMFLHFFVSVASWGWIILANLAGKLMTNDMVYGSFLHLDSTLWTLWNIMKNFANFTLWFLVLYAIVRNMLAGPLGMEDKTWSPINVIKKTLIAGVLIQMSWFFMGAVVDMSTIMTSAIGSFPSQFIASNAKFRWNIQNNLRGLKKGNITFNPDDPKELVKWTPEEDSSFEEDDLNKLMDTLMPSYDSVSGPLLFLGLSVFEFNDFDKYTNLSFSGSGSTNWSDIILSLWLNAIVLLFFSLMMFFIFILNLFRLIILWIVIPLTPIIVLLHVFKLTDKLWWDSAWINLKEILGIKNILMLVFKPVIMVWSLSLILVILVLLQNVISPNKDGSVALWSHWNVSIESVNVWTKEKPLYDSTMKSDWIMEFSMTWFKDTIAGLIVYFFWLFLIYFLVKMTINKGTGIWFIDKSMEWLMNTVESFAKNLPVIPIAWWVGINAIKPDDAMWNISRSMWIDYGAQTSRFRERLWLDKWWEYSSLHASMTRDEFLKTAKNLVDNNTNLKFTDTLLQEKINEWNKGEKRKKSELPIDTDYIKQYKTK